jgi:hypothetical protein
MKTGRCLCGAVRFEYSGPENWMGHCHCESCRRNTASPFTSFLGVPNGSWRWSGEAPTTYHSSELVTRSFCPKCGTPMAYQTEQRPDEIHFYAASLDDQSGYRPTRHFHADEMVDWIELADHLPRK